MLANFSLERQNSCLKEPLVSARTSDPISVKHLKTELAQVCAKGVAYDSRGAIPGNCCIASPVVRPSGIPLSAVSVSGALRNVQTTHVKASLLTATQQLKGQVQANPRLTHG